MTTDYFTCSAASCQRNWCYTTKTRDGCLQAEEEKRFDGDFLCPICCQKEKVSLPEVRHLSAPTGFTALTSFRGSPSPDLWGKD